MNMGKNGRFTSQGLPIVFMYSDQPSGISLEEERRMRRVLKENKIFEAYYRRSAARKPSVVHTWNAKVMITDAAGREVEWKPGSVSTCPAADSSATGGKTEVEVGSVSKCLAADSSATMIGGSVLKRPRVDLGEASQVLVGNLNPGQDSSATGTIEEVKRGSVMNKDLGGSSEIVSII